MNAAIETAEEEARAHSRNAGAAIAFVGVLGLVLELAVFSAVAGALEESLADALRVRQGVFQRSRWPRVFPGACIILAGAQEHVVPAVFLSVVGCVWHI